MSVIQKLLTAMTGTQIREVKVTEFVGNCVGNA